MMRPSEILIKASEYMTIHGWCRHTYEDEHGAVCILGAVRKANLADSGMEACGDELKYILDGYPCKGLSPKNMSPLITEFNDESCHDEAMAIKVLVGAAEVARKKGQ